MRETTKRRCVEEQRYAELMANAAATARLGGKLAKAVAYQQEAAQHYREAWIRLDRLI